MFFVLIPNLFGIIATFTESIDYCINKAYRYSIWNPAALTSDKIGSKTLAVLFDGMGNIGDIGDTGGVAGNDDDDADDGTAITTYRC